MTQTKPMAAHYVSMILHSRCDKNTGYYPIKVLVEPKIVGRGQTAQLAWYAD